MALSIRQKLEAIRQEIEDGNTSLADEMADLGLKAVFAGLGPFDRTSGVFTSVTTAWQDLMEKITTDPTELSRLCGKDKTFNESEWGVVCLAYIAGDSICTAPTARRGGTARTMSEDLTRQMLETLDAEETDLPNLSLRDPFFNQVRK